ncbi:hypothetical protein [Emticicia sp. SJ17W-69]|uniref:hypothetical protein n=1 Tax=Emticicia sp. SJ17W-69 TaxID=3421657 RepID=UPI003EB6FC75
MKTNKSVIEKEFTQNPNQNVSTVDPVSQKEFKNFQIDLDYIVKNCNQIIMIGISENTDVTSVYESSMGISDSEKLAALQFQVEVLKKQLNL